MHRNMIEDNGIYEIWYKTRSSEVVHSGIPGKHIEQTLSKLDNKGIEYDIRRIGDLR